MKSLVLKIHETPHKAVMAITGGGSEAIGELLRYGGGSSTLLEGVIPYDQKAFDSFICGKPDKYCSPGAARDLAMAAFQRGVNFTNTHEHIIGIGASSSLVKDGERSGREHLAYIAVQTASETVSYTIALHGNGYTREEEERKVAEVIVKALAKACNLNVDVVGKRIPDFPIQYAIANKEIQDLVLGQRKILPLNLSESKRQILFPGAFNPMHEQHVNMARKISEITGSKVDLELCVRNVDKPALNFVEINSRTDLLKNQLADSPWIGDLYLTGTPTFAEKSVYFPGVKFLVGWDTFVRISNPKYGDLDKVIQTFNQNNTNFLVFHRIQNGKSSAENMEIEKIHPGLLAISKIYPADILPPVEISSSDIRKKTF